MESLLSTAHLPEAARLFKQINKTNRHFWLIQFRRHCAKRPKEKIQMMVDGFFEGETIFEKWEDENYTPKGVFLRRMGIVMDKK